MINTEAHTACRDWNGTYCCTRPLGHSGPHSAPTLDSLTQETAEWRSRGPVRIRKTYGGVR